MPKRRRGDAGDNDNDNDIEASTSKPKRTSSRARARVSKSTSTSRPATAAAASRRRNKSPVKSKTKPKKNGNDANANVNADVMPDPPASLIRLLQKDQKVLHYFTSLQKNLSSDVKRWKEKATDYEAQLLTIQKERDEHEHEHEDEHDRKLKNNNSNGRNRSRARAKDVSAPVKVIKVPVPTNKNKKGSSASDDMDEKHEDDIDDDEMDSDVSRLDDDADDHSSMSDEFINTGNKRERGARTNKKKKNSNSNSNSDSNGNNYKAKSKAMSKSEKNQHQERTNAKNGVQVKEVSANANANANAIAAAGIDEFIDDDFFAELPSSCGSDSKSDVDVDLDLDLNKKIKASADDSGLGNKDKGEDEEASADADASGSGSSSASGSFGDFEREFNEQIETRTQTEAEKETQPTFTSTSAEKMNGDVHIHDSRTKKAKRARENITIEKEVKKDDEDSDNDNNASISSPPTPILDPEYVKREKHRRHVRKRAFAHLVEAFDNLHKAGVHLVEVYHPPPPILDLDNLEGGYSNNDQIPNPNVTEESKDISLRTCEDDEEKIKTDEVKEQPIDNDMNNYESDSSSEGGFLSSKIYNAKSRATSKNITAGAGYDDMNIGESTNGNTDTVTGEQIGSVHGRPSVPTITRRSDDDVIKDIIKALRTLIRSPTLEVEKPDNHYDKFTKGWFQPFVSKYFLPACYPVEVHLVMGSDNVDGANTARHESDLLAHPLRNGFDMLLRSLFIIDTYCSKKSIFSKTKEWQQLFDENESILFDWEKIQSMQKGMYGRDIVATILSSFDGEITRYWANADRATRLTATALVYLNEFEDSSSSSENSDNDDHTPRPKEAGDAAVVADGTHNLYTFAAKNQNRCFLLMERICMARIVSSLYQYRGDIQNSTRVVLDYVFCTTPSPQIEDFPRYSPTMSMCILEALLQSAEPSPLSSKSQDNNDDKVYIPNQSSWFGAFLKNVEGQGSKSHLGGALRLAINRAVEIWRDRTQSSERRVKEMAMVEVAACERLLLGVEKEWMSVSKEIGSTLSKTSLSNEEYIEDELDKLLSLMQNDHRNCFSLCYSLQVRLLSYGNTVNAMQCCRKAVTLIQNAESIDIASSALISGFITCVALQHLNWESNCLSGLNVDLIRIEIDEDARLRALLDRIIDLFADSKIAKKTVSIKLANLILSCCIILGDGERAYRIAHLVCNREGTSSAKVVEAEQKAILRVCDYPVIRVINLKCRVDRWKQITVQAQRAQILAVLGVASLSLPKRDLSNSIKSREHLLCKKSNEYWGLPAHSGKDVGHLVFEQSLAPQFKESEQLSDFVTSHWSPSDLKMFDSNAARAGATKVRMSVSERACALSHVSSWNGVYNSLLPVVKEVYKKEDRILQVFRISGFARGEPCLAENDGMDPTPVCVIVEDDAMLVDQFNDRLNMILNDLPRDFHFCSIGYSRPKNAPMIQYSGGPNNSISTHIGIPSCLWYLTGYILSLEGAKHLLNALPVRGPVDSWIGMQMSSNWENDYGHRMGVGSGHKVSASASMLPSRIELGVVMKFRAFAALTPLCSQKLSWKSTPSSSTVRGTARWRDRDTDVTYSGTC